MIESPKVEVEGRIVDGRIVNGRKVEDRIIEFITYTFKFGVEYCKRTLIQKLDFCSLRNFVSGILTLNID